MGGVEGVGGVGGGEGMAYDESEGEDGAGSADEPEAEEPQEEEEEGEEWEWGEDAEAEAPQDGAGLGNGSEPQDELEPEELSLHFDCSVWTREVWMTCLKMSSCQSFPSDLVRCGPYHNMCLGFRLGCHLVKLQIQRGYGCQKDEVDARETLVLALETTDPFPSTPGPSRSSGPGRGQLMTWRCG